MKWFKEVTSIEELRSQYKALALKNHPDVGGTVKAMQEINAEYDALFARLKAKKKEDRETCTYDETAENEAFKEVLDCIIHINADIEIVGSWIWIEKGAYEYRELLKSVGFRYASRKKAWYWHHDQYCRRSKKEISLEEIRLKYGSQKVNSQSKQYTLN